MASIKRDDNKQKWEETEFPLVCETCLGDNPYVRMTKENHGKKCKICDTPFTVFAWQAGTKGRLKKVEICKTCAQAKNVCQVCIYDLQYGLPVALRDKVLRDNGGGGGSSGALANVPQSAANRSWFTAQQERALEQGVDLNPTSTIAHAKLSDMARMEPRYERNLPKLCSFYAKGECNRGSKCPFRHEMPRDRNDPLSKQNTKDRFYGTQDPVAGKLIARQKRREEQAQMDNNDKGGIVKRGDQGYDERSKSTLYVRFVDPNKAAPRMNTVTTTTSQESSLSSTPPKLTETMIRDSFYSFGEIVAVRMHPSSNGAFVEYTHSQATELAIASMNRKFIQGFPVFVAWARAPKRGNTTTNTPGGQHSQSQSSQGPSSSSSDGGVRPAPPPRNQTTSNNCNKSATRTTSRPLPAGLVPAPRPGGGVIRGGGAIVAKRTMGHPSKQQQPYYPSADPSRLGTSTTATAKSSDS